MDVERKRTNGVNAFCVGTMNLRLRFVLNRVEIRDG